MGRSNYNWGDTNTATILAREGISIKMETIQPDTGERWHFHKTADQWFLFREGDLLIETQKERLHLEAEQCIHVPPLMAHKVWNITSKPVQFYLISSRDTREDVFFLEHVFPSIQSLHIDCNDLRIRVLDKRDSIALGVLIQQKRAQLEAHFPTSTGSLKKDAELVTQLNDSSITPFGIFKAGQLIGYLSVKDQIRYSGSCELAYWLDRSFQGKGMMSAALRSFIVELALHFGFRNFTARVRKDNHRSIAMLRRLGFTDRASTDELVHFHLGAKIFIQQSGLTKVLPHSKERSTYFKSLNAEWIEELFEIEKADHLVLDHPEEKIIAPGGEIFYLQLDGAIVSTGAIMPLINGEYELTKMATTKKYQGLGFGEAIIKEVIHWSRKKRIASIMLYTQSTLFKALKLYEKYGFEKEEFDQTHYKRADVKMRLRL